MSVRSSVSYYFTYKSFGTYMIVIMLKKSHSVKKKKSFPRPFIYIKKRKKRYLPPASNIGKTGVRTR